MSVPAAINAPEKMMSCVKCASSAILRIAPAVRVPMRVAITTKMYTDPVVGSFVIGQQVSKQWPDTWGNRETNRSAHRKFHVV